MDESIMNDAGGPIVVFDAMCVLCSVNAQFILKHDRNRHFRLASMQYEVGADLYRRFGIDPADPESIIVVDGEKFYRDSDAVLAIYYRPLGTANMSSRSFSRSSRTCREKA
ncbi:thiol-disulfide oxidoreductase DCC family protein [Rhizobium sp. HT1-10]|uniref:thiol-disulfide oxidoreductase DCC family protein n=1 Tax=Rhizobium sp. HT1-10 TaxID=3111638 RepID=UPI003C300260